ncbi:MAG: ankyrin repeat domain-containing protein [Gammaproteobacteria bacterium]|nr:ankyrin repeat domain-containing protein [Gammaproteobacteria bacterium]
MSMDLLEAVWRNNPDLVRALLASDQINVNYNNFQRCTPLMYAAGSGKFEIVLILLNAGADKLMQNRDNCTSLMLAAFAGRVEMVQTLLSVEKSRKATLEIAQSLVTLAKSMCEVDGSVIVLEGATLGDEFRKRAKEADLLQYVDTTPNMQSKDEKAFFEQVGDIVLEAAQKRPGEEAMDLSKMTWSDVARY